MKNGEGLPQAEDEEREMTCSDAYAGPVDDVTTFDSGDVDLSAEHHLPRFLVSADVDRQRKDQGHNDDRCTITNVVHASVG